MKISEMITTLLETHNRKGDIDILVASSYEHFEIKWVDYYEKRDDCKEHFCIRLDDAKYIDNRIKELKEIADDEKSTIKTEKEAVP